VKVEVLARKENGDASANSFPEPSVTVANQAMANRFRKVALPQLSPAAMRDNSGKVVKLRILLDPFGNPKTVTVLECPKGMESEFRAAALRTQFAPIQSNGRSQQGWIEMSYRITDAGVSAM
jgi:hypothetical protein